MSYEPTRDERRGLYATPGRTFTGDSTDAPYEDHTARSIRCTRPMQRAALAMGDIFACPYVTRGLPYHDPHGTCVFGCWEEPTCITGGPPDEPGAYCEQVDSAWRALGELSRSPVWRRLTRPGRVAPPPPPGAASPA